MTNIDFDRKKVRINTPMSNRALLELGLIEDDLFKIDKKKYLSLNPQLKAESQDIQDRRYEHYEQRRQKAIEDAIRKREEILNSFDNYTDKDRDKNIFTKYSSNNNRYFLTQNHFFNNRSHSIDRFGFNKNKNSKNNDNNKIDSTMIKKEMEKLKLIKKQQVGEIRNLIDYEYFLNEVKKRNEQKEIENQIKEERIKKEKLRQQKLKEERMKQKEEERIEKKRREEEEMNRKYQEQEEKRIQNEKKEKLKKEKLEKEMTKRKEEAKLAAQELRQRMEKNLEEEMNIRINKQRIME